ncbi:hypothetical protein P389DRAFT_160212 [Cystobasidium minutum MCA 4210]|uniref:uncharacterized protein n=1 Tax=Cystobasidium minutum MCA 4210 TaxID=1397322 RepID=UPI0034D0168C|eukprot:jgi/Rhomi1/160212/estExt_Genewise1Plus.C_4_t10092
MDIDTLEEVAQNAPSAQSDADALHSAPSAVPVQKSTKKKNKKKDALAEVDTADEDVKTASVPTSSKAPISSPAKEVDSGMTDLQKRMQKKLGGARFRWINEQLYTTSGVDALQLMEEDPAMFEDYHNGFASQAASWPTQPIHLFIDQFKGLSSSKSTSPKPVIADLGCGKAELARTLVPLGFTVLSYDLVEEEPFIVKAQCTKRLPLPGMTLAPRKEDNADGAVVDVVVCCLSLMGNDWLGMIKEARRVLKMNGKLKIAEVTSRFTDVKDFIQLINAIGFKLIYKDESNTHFILFEFEKIPLQTCKSTFLTHRDEDKVTISQELLKPCIYKRR